MGYFFDKFLFFVALDYFIRNEHKVYSVVSTIEKISTRLKRRIIVGMIADRTLEPNGRNNGISLLRVQEVNSYFIN